jgi:hypothetical protein
MPHCHAKYSQYRNCEVSEHVNSNAILFSGGRDVLLYLQVIGIFSLFVKGLLTIMMELNCLMFKIHIEIVHIYGDTCCICEYILLYLYEQTQRSSSRYVWNFYLPLVLVKILMGS